MSVWRDPENWLNEVEAADLAYLTPDERAEYDRLTEPPVWSPRPENVPQQRAFACTADVIGYGGSAGGGKSDLLLGLACRKHIRSMILRRESAQMLALIDRSREVFGGRGTYNGTDKVWRLNDGRQIEFGGVANPGDEQKYRGRPHDLLGVDEADQVPLPVVRFLSGWLRSTRPGQICQLVLCFNPPSTVEGRWLIDYFAPWVDDTHPRQAAPGELRWYATLKGGKEVECPDGSPFTDQGETIRPQSRTFFPARVTDNPCWQGTDYVAKLQALPEPLRSQLLYGDMRAGLTDDAWQVIPTAWVRAAMQRWREGAPGAMSCVGADVARGGKSKTVVARRFGNWVANLEKCQGPQTATGPLAAQFIMRLHDGEAPVNIDATGVGASAYDAAREIIGEKVVAVNFGAGTSMFDRTGKFPLANVRAAMYWTLREALDPETGQNIALPNDPELLGELIAARYSVKARGIILEEKDKIAERLGRSPDSADAVALAFWSEGNVVPRALVIDGSGPEPGTGRQPQPWDSMVNDDAAWTPFGGMGGGNGERFPRPDWSS